MAKARGKVATIEISDDGETFIAVGQRVDGSYSIDTDTIEATHCDSDDKEAIYGDAQLKMDVSFRYDPDDAGQADLIGAAFSKATRYFRFRARVGAGLSQQVFAGRITSVSTDVAMGSVEEIKATIESTGAIDPSLQPGLQLVAPADVDHAHGLELSASIVDPETGTDEPIFTLCYADAADDINGAFTQMANGTGTFEPYYEGANSSNLGYLLVTLFVESPTTWTIPAGSTLTILDSTGNETVASFHASLTITPDTGGTDIRFWVDTSGALYIASCSNDTVLPDVTARAFSAAFAAGAV